MFSSTRSLVYGLLIVTLSISACKKDDDTPPSPTPQPQGCGSTVTDIDGNVYPVVTIGGRCWMAANLRTTRYANGTVIPQVTDPATWADQDTDAWCWQGNDGTLDAIYGKLYTWYAAANNPCPTGWHVPSDAEWKTLELALGMPPDSVDLPDERGGSTNVGGKMKSLSTHWVSPNVGATNVSGFSAEPAGIRYDYPPAEFNYVGTYAYWWTTDEVGDEAWQRSVANYAGWVYRSPRNKGRGACIRCLKN